MKGSSIALMMFVSSAIYSLEIHKIENVPNGNYVAKRIDENQDGKHISSIYGNIVGVVLANKSKLNIKDIEMKFKNYCLDLNYKDEIDYSKVELVVLHFENGYTPNANIGEKL